jgi:hypothetical protein
LISPSAFQTQTPVKQSLTKGLPEPASQVERLHNATIEIVIIVIVFVIFNTKKVSQSFPAKKKNDKQATEKQRQSNGAAQYVQDLKTIKISHVLLFYQ